MFCSQFMSKLNPLLHQIESLTSLVFTGKNVYMSCYSLTQFNSDELIRIINPLLLETNNFTARSMDLPWKWPCMGMFTSSHVRHLHLTCNKCPLLGITRWAKYSESCEQQPQNGQGKYSIYLLLVFIFIWCFI